MADTSSDEDIPLAQRPLAGGILLAGAAPRAAAALGSSDDDSDVPSWLQAKAKGKQVVNLESSSEDEDAVMSPAKPTAAARPAEPAGNRSTQEPATQQQAAPASAAPKSAAKARATPGRGRAAAAAAAPPPATQDDGAGPSATQPSATQATGTQATGGGTVQKRAAGVAGLPHAPTSSMAVVLPDKLPQIKMLVELECGAGGAVGHGRPGMFACPRVLMPACRPPPAAPQPAQLPARRRALCRPHPSARPCPRPALGPCRRCRGARRD